jgi:hypothetical protein
MIVSIDFRALRVGLCAIVLVACAQREGVPSSSAETAPDKQLCKTAIMSLIDAQRMMSDGQGRVVQLTAQQEAQMKALIQTGLTAGEAVSRDYLMHIHPQLEIEFRTHLLAGWRRYLNGLNQSKPEEQVAGIELVRLWEQFKASNADLLYERIIE